MKRKEDLRVRKTKLNLYNGLLKLMEEKPFEDIKVTDICNKALVNRSTFYDHFNDKYELFESYVVYVGKLCYERVSISVDSKDSINELFIEYMKILLDEIDSNFDQYKVIFINNYNSYINKSLVDIFTKSIMSKLEEDFKFNDLSIVKLGVYFYVSGAISMIEYGFYNNLPFDKEKILGLFNKIIPKFDNNNRK